MDNKEAIEILKQLDLIVKNNNSWNETATNAVSEACNLAIKALEEKEWIPVSERLPNTLGVYNVTRKLNEGETIYFISGASYFDGQNTWHADTGVNHGRPYLTDIIAWKPLPEPYKENDK